ncbi:MAG: ROK family protein [Bacteroidetes bacterium]|nr:ROK family protein [Bacteroidota bacterium]MCL5737089.1 ROK family protein [Bacteroidota bacterium]
MTKISPSLRATSLSQHNASVVFANIFYNGPITQREISRISGLSFTTTAAIVSRLKKRGIIERSIESSTNGGRPAALYRCNPSYRYVMGIEAQHDKLYLIVSDLAGHVLSRSTTPFDKKIGKDGFLDLLLQAVKNLIDSFKGQSTRFLGVGIGVGGLVDPKDGSVSILSHLPDWGNLSLKSIVEGEFHLKVFVQNNSDAAALGELRYGLGRGKRNFLFINVKDGIGMGIVLNGELYMGTSGTAGEFGHITVDDHGPVCTCGNVGCLETLTSVPALVQNAKKSITQGVTSMIKEIAGGDLNAITFPVLLEAAKQEDKLAYKLFTDVGRYLGEGIVSLVNLLNPELIIIGGDFVQAGDLILEPINDVLRRQALELPRKAVEVVFSKLGESASALGSVVPLVEEFVASPLSK